MIRIHGGIIHKISRLYRHEEEDQKDLFQEIVIQVWKSWPQYRGDAKISTWIYRIALNTAIGDFRKKKRTVETVSFDHEPPELVRPDMISKKKNSWGNYMQRSGDSMKLTAPS